MTVITYDRENFTISAEGHTGYGAAGSDIVCAAVSTLMHSLAAYLSAKRDILEEDAQIETLGGFMVIKCRPAKGHRREVRAVFDMFETGVSNISAQYPKYVWFRMKGETKG